MNQKEVQSNLLNKNDICVDEKGLLFGNGYHCALQGGGKSFKSISMTMRRFKAIRNGEKVCLSCGTVDSSSLIVLSTEPDKNSFCYCNSCLRHRALPSAGFPIFKEGIFTCDITGEKNAIRYESYGEVYHLSGECLRRLLLRDLSPEEYFVLRKKYGGERYSLGKKFYDEKTGEALQPFRENT